MIKTLHVLEENSLKNFSINQLIHNLSFFLKKKKLINDYFVTTNNRTKHQKKTLEIKNNNEDFKNVIQKKKITYVHIHGIWKLYYLQIILFCELNSIKYFIHPHGMLVKEALISKGYFSYIQKKLFLLIFLFFRNKKFIAITEYESAEIKKIFPNAAINLVPNIYINKKINNLNNFFFYKRFIFLGRVNSHKNIHIFIKAFLEANLKDWYLEIYGIDDDDHYKKYILNLIGKNKNILLKKPVFGSKKIKLIKASWANILISNSEVMSYSVIESSHGGLPSLVFKNIAINKYSSYIKNFFILKNLDIQQLKKSFIKISNLSLTQRLKQGLNVKNFIKKEYKPNTIYNIYKNKIYLINKKNSNTVIDFKKEKFLINYIFNNFYLIPVILNFFIPQLLVLLLIYKNLFNYIGIHMSVTISLINLLVMSFSLNSRNEILAKKKNYLKYFYLRILLSFIFFIFIGYLYHNLYNQLNYLIILLFCFNVLLNWILEVFFYQDKLCNKYNYTFIKLFFDIFYLTSASISILFNEVLLLYIFLAYFIFNFSFFIWQIYKKIIFFKIKYLNIYKIFNISLYSSILIVLSSLVNKLIIINYFSKDITAILFFCFSIFSFPSTFITYFLSPPPTNTFKIFNIKHYINNIISIASYLGLFSLFFINYDNNFLLKVVIFSFLGFLFLISSSVYRGEVIQHYKKKAFTLDILFSLITIFIMLLILFVNSNLISYFFATTSLVSLLMFRYLYFHLTSQKEK
jgi:hypothetical protein